MQQHNTLFSKMGGANNDDIKHGLKAHTSIPKLFSNVQAIAMLATRKSHFDEREGAKSRRLAGSWLTQG